MKNGDIVYGKITSIVGYGAFVQVDDYDGLVHISEFSDHFVRDINDYVHIGGKARRTGNLAVGKSLEGLYYRHESVCCRNQ